MVSDQMYFLNHKALWEYKVIILIKIMHLEKTSLRLFFKMMGSELLAPIWEKETEWLGFFPP